MNKVFFPVFLCAFVLITWTSCFNEEFVDSQSEFIGTSVDTLRFDTVFTSIGSATRQFKIYNRSDRNMLIKSVRLANDNSKFRINVDGISSNRVDNLNSLALDSLYVFVEVTINPDEPLSTSPFVISENLVIETDNGDKTVVIEAWGQNANYFPSKDSKGRLVRLTCDNGTVVWDDPKPYVVYGLLFIDSCGLMITPGTRIHVHGGLGLIDGAAYNDGGLLFMQDGRIEAVGTVENPIIFEGDRLEADFGDVLGQWAGIRLLSNSQNNKFENVIIKNSIIGIRSDSASSVSINSCIIYNTSSAGIIGLNSSIVCDNSLVHNNDGQSAILSSGGDYLFRHTTLANYGNQAPALYVDNYDCVNQSCDETIVRPIRAMFYNSIIVGSNADEIDLVDINQGSQPENFQLLFSNTLIRVNELKMSIDLETICESCIEFDNEPLFIDNDNYDFHLDTASVVRDNGIYISELPVDLDGNIRDMESPDLGCYEFSDF